MNSLKVLKISVDLPGNYTMFDIVIENVLRRISLSYPQS